MRSLSERRRPAQRQDPRWLREPILAGLRIANQRSACCLRTGCRPALEGGQAQPSGSSRRHGRRLARPTIQLMDREGSSSAPIGGLDRATQPSSSRGWSDNDCLLLIDHDNLLPPHHNQNPEALSHELLRLVRIVRELRPGLGRFTIRLYGGWYSQGILTSHGSRISQQFAGSDLFPLVDDDGVIIRGSIALVQELLASPAYLLADTYRPSGGMPTIRLASRGTPADCPEDRERCPIYIAHRVSRWKADTCPHDSCSVGMREAVVSSRQKMVDTLLACDVLYAGQNTPSTVCVVTSDLDLVPPLLHLASTSDRRNLIWIESLADLPPEYGAMLEASGTECVRRQKEPT